MMLWPGQAKPSQGEHAAHSGSCSLEGPSHCRRAAFVITKRIKEYKYELHAPQQVACEAPTHTYAHLYIEIFAQDMWKLSLLCAGYLTDRERKRERERPARMPNMACLMPHAFSLPPARLSWICQLLQVQLMPAARPALSHFVYPLNNELWAPGLGHVMADNLHIPREKCNFRKEAAKKYNVTKCAMC